MSRMTSKIPHYPIVPLFTFAFCVNEIVTTSLDIVL